MIGPPDRYSRQLPTPVPPYVGLIILLWSISQYNKSLKAKLTSLVGTGKPWPTAVVVPKKKKKKRMIKQPVIILTRIYR